MEPFRSSFQLALTVSFLALLIQGGNLVGCANAWLVTEEQTEIQVIPNPHAGGATTSAKKRPNGAGQRDLEDINLEDENGKNWVSSSLSALDSDHSIQAGGSSCAVEIQSLLNLHHLMIEPMVTQPDTFQDLEYAKVGLLPVPIYRMKQPRRISAAELPFSMVLVRQLGAITDVAGEAAAVIPGSVRFLPVDPVKSLDSWFPGYAWTPMAYQCNTTATSTTGKYNDGDGGFRHVGWRFQAIHGGSVIGDSFYALLVQVDRRRKRVTAVRSYRASI